MKKIVVLLLSLLILTLGACAQTGGVVVATQAEQPSETAAPTEASAVQESTAPAPEPTSGVSPVSGDVPKMYTSYAHMIAFDPDTGIASFDYFDMLRNDGAVQWLVEQEGYTTADAQALVSEYADSEYIEKNTNSQLRMVDLSAVPVTLIVGDDGSLIENLEPRAVSIETLKAMYASGPNLLLKPFFYEVKVSADGQVESVNQVYWP